MAKFCGKCGTKLDEATGLCPNCGPAKAPQEEPKKEELKQEAPKKAKKEKKPRKPLTKKVKRLLIILAAVVLVAIVLLLLFGSHNSVPDEFPTLPTEDAGAYYEENSTIIQIIDAKSSNAVPSQKEVVAYLTERGFTQYPIEAMYTMNGDYLQIDESSAESEDCHPMYCTYYVNASGEIWVIYVINGVISATPASYNMLSSLGVEVCFSESGEITSYDSVTNQFFVTIPHDTALIVHVIDRIDAEALEWYTAEEIDNYG